MLPRRGSDSDTHDTAALHPAQAELAVTRSVIAHALSTVDEWLRQVGNQEPKARDALLDIRRHLTGANR